MKAFATDLVFKRVLNMFKLIFLSLFTTILPLTSTYSEELKCSMWPAEYVESLCNCGDELKNLEITIPQGMEIMSVCLSDAFSSPPKLIDLTKEKISLDKYTNGNMPYGTISLKGELIINGEIQVDRGPSSDYIFLPKWGGSKLNTAFGDQLSIFKFVNDDLNAAFRVDEDLMMKGCSYANATIKFNGIRVLIGETDQQGAYPIGTKVINISEYNPCKN